MIDTTALPPSSLHEKLGIEITRASAAEVVGSMPVTGNTQPAGLLHGGATAALIEGLASLAAWLHAHPERVAVGVDLNVTHLRPVTSGKVTGRAVPVRLRNRRSHGRCPRRRRTTHRHRSPDLPARGPEEVITSSVCVR